MDNYKNFAYTTVTVAPSPATSGTTLTVSDGTLLPSVPFNATVYPNGSIPTIVNAEIIRVTAKSGNDLTIIRTQEATSARSITIGDIVLATITNKTLTDINAEKADVGSAPTAHAASHENAGSDEINVVGLSGLLADSQTPLAHKTSHQAAGSDAIKLDDLAAPDDNTDLNASTTAHGLMQKYPGGTTNFLREDGSFAAPPGVGSGIPETLIDAKGDLVVGSAADTAARLPVSGTNGRVLTEDSTQTLGVAWAAPATDTFWDTTIIKSVDEAVNNSAALQDDDELQFSVVGGASYYFELILIYDQGAGGTAAADIKHAFALSTGSFNRAWRQHVGLGPTTAVIQASQVADMTTVIVNAETGEHNIVFVKGYVSPSADATLKLQWAQNSAQTYDTRVRAGSILRYRRMI